MSHFSVLVVTTSRPSQADLERIMMPWHEFECTGYNNEYVQDIDRTEEALAEFANATVTRIKAPDGTLHSFFDEKGEWRREFSQTEKDTIFGTDRRTYFVPSGYEKVEVPAPEVESAAEWISGYYGWPVAGQSDGYEAKYGYIEIDASGNVVKCIDRTNPDRKWDWWVVGGRWSGHLRLKDHATPILGKRGLMGSHADDHPKATDQAMIRDLDIVGVTREAEAEAAALWDKVSAVVGDMPKPDDFQTVVARNNNDYTKAREEYWAQPVIAAIKNSFPEQFGHEREIEASSTSRAEFIVKSGRERMQTFAVVKDGKWYERGKMGWWACVSNEMDADDWSTEFYKLILGLPETDWLTVVDCHI